MVSSISCSLTSDASVCSYFTSPCQSCSDLQVDLEIIWVVGICAGSVISVATNLADIMIENDNPDLRWFYPG